MRPWKGKAAAEGSQIVTSKPGFGLGPDYKPQARPLGSWCTDQSRLLQISVTSATLSPAAASAG